MPGSYATVDDAAAAALYRINRQPRAAEAEYIGLIYEDPDTGEYLFTDFQERGSRNSARGEFYIPKDSLRGIIHQHPASKHRDNYREYLSAEDMRMSRQFGVPSYIGVDNALLRWDPETGRTREGFHEFSLRRRSTESDNRLGIPEEVLARIPIEEITARSEELRRAYTVEDAAKDALRELIEEKQPAAIGPPR